MSQTKALISDIFYELLDLLEEAAHPPLPQRERRRKGKRKKEKRKRKRKRRARKREREREKERENHKQQLQWVISLIGTPWWTRQLETVQLRMILLLLPSLPKSRLPRRLRRLRRLTRSLDAFIEDIHWQEAWTHSNEEFLKQHRKLLDCSWQRRLFFLMFQAAMQNPGGADKGFHRIQQVPALCFELFVFFLTQHLNRYRK